MLKSIESDGVNICSFEHSDKLNSTNAELVKKEFSSHFAEPGARVVFDLGNITFIDSSGFAALLSVKKIAASSSGLFRVCSLTPRVAELFRLLQLDRIFEIYPDREDCLESFT